MHNRTERNEDHGDQRMKGLTVFTGTARPIGLVTRDVVKMGKGGRQWLRPGDLSEYGRERIRRIRENNDKLNSLQLKNIAASVFGSVQTKHSSEKGKRKRVDVDDDDYMQPNSKDHSDDEFSDSFELEVRVDGALNTITFVVGFLLTILGYIMYLTNDSNLGYGLLIHELFF
ncbi:hypothetical protein U1Q18_038005 [Sarracenia purpurea var. burkii]